jgi:cysteine desulfuration protein SufE
MSGGYMDKNQQILTYFEGSSGWEQRYKKLIDLGKTNQGLSDDDKMEDNKVKGCTSNVWITAKNLEGKLFFQSDSDALIVKGLAYLLCEFYSNREPKSIIGLQATFLQDLKMAQHLTASRANGLLAMVKKIQFYALAYSQLEDMKS